MPKNKLNDLNNHLFEQLERLNDDELKGEELDKEIKRAKAMSDIANQIVGTASISLQAIKLVGNGLMSKDDKTLFIS